MNLPFKTLDQLFQYFNHEDKVKDFLEKQDGLMVRLFALPVVKEGLIIMEIAHRKTD